MRLTRILGTVVLLAVCTVALLTVVIPFALGAQSYTVLTGSMRPGLQPGSLIAVRPVDAADVRIGDVITFQLRSGEPEVATHRVVAVGVDGHGDRVFTTRGDANNTDDLTPVRAVQVRGVLVYAVPWVGYLNLWATPSVKSVLVVVIGVAAISWGVMTLLRDARRRRRMSAAGAVAALLLAAGLSLAAPAPPARATDAEPLQVSVDGRTWVTGPTLTLFADDLLLVPGDSVHAGFWVRSTAEDTGDLSVTTEWRPMDSTDRNDVALAHALAVSSAAPSTLDPGQHLQVGLTVSLAASASDDTRRGSSELVVTVRLAERTTADEGALPRTGAAVPVPVIIAGGALVALGAALLLKRRRRNPRE